MILTVKNNKVMLKDRAYSVGKKLVQIWIPATSSLYLGLAHVWGWSNIEEVVGTLAVLATFLGVVLHISSTQYDASGAAFDGHMTVQPAADTGLPKVQGIHFDGLPQELAGKDSITFKVNHDPTPEEPSYDA